MLLIPNGKVKTEIQSLLQRKDLGTIRALGEALENARLDGSYPTEQLFFAHLTFAALALEYRSTYQRGTLPLGDVQLLGALKPTVGFERRILRGFLENPIFNAIDVDRAGLAEFVQNFARTSPVVALLFERLKGAKGSFDEGSNYRVPQSVLQAPPEHFHEVSGSADLHKYFLWIVGFGGEAQEEESPADVDPALVAEFGERGKSLAPLTVGVRVPQLVGVAKAGPVAVLGSLFGNGKELPHLLLRARRRGPTASKGADDFESFNVEYGVKKLFLDLRNTFGEGVRSASDFYSHLIGRLSLCSLRESLLERLALSANRELGEEDWPRNPERHVTKFLDELNPPSRIFWLALCISAEKQLRIIEKRVFAKVEDPEDRKNFAAVYNAIMCTKPRHFSGIFNGLAETQDREEASAALVTSIKRLAAIAITRGEFDQVRQIAVDLALAAPGAISDGVLARIGIPKDITGPHDHLGPQALAALHYLSYDSAKKLLVGLDSDSLKREAEQLEMRIAALNGAACKFQPWLCCAIQRSLARVEFGVNPLRHMLVGGGDDEVLLANIREAVEFCEYQPHNEDLIDSRGRILRISGIVGPVAIHGPGRQVTLTVWPLQGAVAFAACPLRVYEVLKGISNPASADT